MMKNIVRSLIKKGLLPGSILKGNDYTPSVFALKQTEAALRFYKTNGYLEYDRAADMQLRYPAQFVQRQDAMALALESLVVGSTIVEQLVANAAETIRSQSLTHIPPFVTSLCPATADDIALMLQTLVVECSEDSPWYETVTMELGSSDKEQTAKKKNESHLACRVMAGVFVVSTGFLDKCWGLIEQEAERQAQRDLEEQRKRPTSSSHASGNAASKPAHFPDDYDSSEEEGKGRKGKKGKRGKGSKGKRRDKNREREEEELEAIEAAAAAASRGGKKKRDRGGAGGSGGFSLYFKVADARMPQCHLTHIMFSPFHSLI